ncbi:flagellin, partial [Tepidicella xavieri]|uniref:flagellin n=1 Tax=Tepidicella xavieri TaxID=360241 RepID=UPI001FEA6175
TAEGALSNIGNNLQRIRELAVQSANATNSASDRAALQAEVAQLVGEISRIAESTNFNGLKLLDGSYKNQNYQVGANAGDTISISVADSRAAALGATTLASVADAADERIASNVAVSGALTINGVAIDTSGLANGDISGLIGRINDQSSATGVTAARATVTQAVIASTDLGAGESGAIRLNGTAISINDTQGASPAALVARINEFSTQTGVTAEVLAGNNIRFTSSIGADIVIQDYGTNTVFGDVTTESTFVAGIELRTRAGGTITAAGAVAGSLYAASTGANAGEANTYTVNGLSVTTVENANNAIKAVDFALQSVNSARADLGAVQNRFNAVVANLQVNAENLSASRSRIQDADFAAETAALSRAQILQQAGTAMVAQANQLPQGVLALLR